MLRGWLFLSRPFSISLGLFIGLNLFLAIKEPRLSANQIWLSVPIAEPWLSGYVSVLALALLLPHAWSKRRWLRCLQGGVLAGFLVLAAGNVFSFYHKLREARIQSHALFPFSLVIAAILSLEIVRILRWAPATAPIPRPARRFFGAVLVLVACFAMVLAHIYTFGLTDYTGHADGAPAAVVLGAKVYPGGRLSNALEDRMRTAVRLFHDGKVDYLILSGGVEESGVNEPDAMARFAIDSKVPRERLLCDYDGRNTYLSAINCSALARQHGFPALIVVSQYFHNARVKLIFERAGIPSFTVPAEPARRFQREAYFLFREALAFPYYLLFHHG
jgi:vancomycin permeability regulator SanA